MDDDWDLQAVVRGFCSAVSSSSSSSTTTTATNSSASTTTTGTPTWPVDACSNQQKSTLQAENFMGFFPDLSQQSCDNSIEQFFHDLYNPLDFPKLQKPPPSPQSIPISPLSVLGGLQDLSQQQQQQQKQQVQQHHHQHQQQQKQLIQPKQQPFGISRCTSGHAQGPTRSKKRKNQMKRVCQVPAEGLSSDMWSWRKYGQKPIKGSPYPRGYYRCSTSKGCMARKQVERNRSDPAMFIVTYTGEHSHAMPTHRNSLAGSTRNKPTTSGDDDNSKSKLTSSSPVSPAASLSPATEKTEEEKGDDTDDDNFGVSDVVMDDDFFEGLDELVDPAIGDSFSDAYQAEVGATASFPWLSNSVANTTTTAAGGS